MAARETQGTNIEPGLVQRVVAGIRYAVSGVTPESWFGPAQPLAPQAQEKTEGRAFDYPVGFNLRTTPRGEEAVSFAQLRGLADGYDLLRLVIETRKDQIESFDWEIVPADAKAAPGAQKAEIKAATDFLQRPDKEHMWPQWLRMLLEEMFVLDAMCVYPRATRGGQLYGLEIVDGSTIKRVLDDTGRTPLPPDPAYQQILKGIPAGDYTSETLVYMMRNPRISRIYGYGPVEQIITTVNIALRRQMTQLAAYTEGNIPEAIAQVPAAWTAKQIMDFQTWWDSALEGNLSAKRRMVFVPNLDGIKFTKEQVLKDEMDEWLARIVCFCFSVSPSALIKMVNRASGEQMADTAKEEGLMPLLRFLEAFFTQLVQRNLGFPGLRFAWKIVNRVAPEQQAEIHGIYVDKQVLTPDEVREDLGRVPMTPEERAAAFPPPPAPVLPGDETEDGPGETKGPKGATKPGQSATEADTGETAAEKMLGEALHMLTPERQAEVFSKVAAETAQRMSAQFGASREELLKLQTLYSPNDIAKAIVDATEPGRAAEAAGVQHTRDLLTKTVDKLDPERLAKVITEAAASQAPRVVEVRPEIAVDVGDTVIHMPVQRGQGKGS